MNKGEVLVKVENLSKKFCKDLKLSLAYGMQDVARELMGKSSKEGLRKNEFWAVNNVNFEIRRGECVGFAGHNGAGKSTLLKVLNGLIKPDKGSVTIYGRVAALIELGAGFNPILTGRENIYNNASVLGFSKKEIDEKLEQIIDFSEIREFIDAPVQTYSSGMKVRLGFSVAAQMEPDVLIVDEVLAVGDIGFRIKCLNRISELLKTCAVIFVTHSMPQIGRVCTHIANMTKGEIKYWGTDIGYGISLYQEGFKKEKSTLIGSGIEILDFNLNGVSGINHKIEYNKNIEIQLRVRNTSAYNNFFFNLIIMDANMNNVAMVSSRGIDSDKFKEVESDFYKFQVSFKSFLTLGKFSANLVFVEEIESSDYKHGIIFCNFRSYLNLEVVNAPLLGVTPIEFIGEWS